MSNLIQIYVVNVEKHANENNYERRSMEVEIVNSETDLEIWKTEIVL